MTRLAAATRRTHQLLAVTSRPLTLTTISEITSTPTRRAHQAMTKLLYEGCADQHVTSQGTYYTLRTDRA